MARFQDPGRIIGFDTAKRVGATVADSNVQATFKAAHDGAPPGAGGRLDCAFRSSLIVRATFDTSARTASLKALFYSENLDEDGAPIAGDDSFIGASDAVAVNATAQEDDAGRFTSAIQFIPCEGFHKFRIKIESLSGGNIDVFAGSVQ